MLIFTIVYKVYNHVIYTHLEINIKNLKVRNLMHVIQQNHFSHIACYVCQK